MPRKRFDTCKVCGGERLKRHPFCKVHYAASMREYNKAHKPDVRDSIRRFTVIMVKQKFYDIFSGIGPGEMNGITAASIVRDTQF